MAALIELALTNVPTILLVAALVIAWLQRRTGCQASQALALLLLLPVGVEMLWAGFTHVLFPETAARFIGWQVSPFQFEVGMPTQMRTLSPAGGCVLTAVTRQMAGLFGSTAADSIVVFGSATLARLSQERTAFALAIAGFGGVCINGAAAGPPPPPRPPGPPGAPPRPPCGVCA